MPLKNSLLFIVVWLLQNTFSIAQSRQNVFSSISQKPNIASVQFLKDLIPQESPVITLHSLEKLTLSFDDIAFDQSTYVARIAHCNSNGQLSNLTNMDFNEGLNDVQISASKSSQATLMPYQHFTLQIPSADLSPKIAGVYLLTVFENGDPQNIVFSRYFFVMNPAVDIQVKPKPTPQTDLANQTQKLDIILSTQQLNIGQPESELKIWVMQNNRFDNIQTISQPSSISKNKISYSSPKTLIFEGGNHFRTFDIRNLQSPGIHVERIKNTSIYEVDLKSDEDWSNIPYEWRPTQNGNFTIGNLSELNPENLSLDYAKVSFTLKTTPEEDGKIFVIGSFNQFQPLPNFQLKLDESTKTWKLNVPFKQGIYDYQYVLVDKSGQRQLARFSGNHVETPNSYQVFVFHRKSGTYWDELIGYKSIMYY